VIGSRVCGRWHGSGVGSKKKMSVLYWWRHSRFNQKPDQKSQQNWKNLVLKFCFFLLK